MPVDSKSRANSETGSERPEAYIAVLAEFARFGFRRTSMVGLADAAGVSRQTLYNRFGGKEAVLDWAVSGLSQHTRAEALAGLSTFKGTSRAVLQEVFWRWLGTVAVMLHQHRFAEEILGLGKAALARSQKDPLEGISGEVAAFLLERGVRSSKSGASDTAFTLAMSAKGLMQSCGSEDAFRKGMSRVLSGAGID